MAIGSDVDNPCMEHPTTDEDRRRWLQATWGSVALRTLGLNPGASAGAQAQGLLSARLGRLALASGALASTAGCAQRDAAPDVEYVRLDGSRGRTGESRGKVLFVNFWATSCASCVAEMPDLVATHQRFHPRGYETLAVAMSYDPPAYVASFTERRQLPFWVAIDNTGAVAKAFGDIRLTPTSFLIDKQSRIVKRYVGMPDFKALHGLIEDLLAES